MESYCSIVQPEFQRIASGATAKAAVDILRRVYAERGIVVDVAGGRLVTACR